LNSKFNFKNISLIIFIFCSGWFFSEYEPFSLSDLLKFNPIISNENRLEIFSSFFALVVGLWLVLSYFNMKRKEQNDFVKNRTSY
jgi:hypothetical protein